MNKLFALFLGLGLSVSAFSQSTDRGVVGSVSKSGEELIEIDQEDLERALKELSESLRKQRTNSREDVKTSLLRQQLLLHLLNSRTQVAPVVQGGSDSYYVAPQAPARERSTESYDARLDRIETMLMLLLNQRADAAAPNNKTIIRRNGKATPLDTQIQLVGTTPRVDQDRVARLEEQLSRLLQQKHRVDTVYRIDTVQIHRMDTIRMPQIPQMNLQAPTVVSVTDTVRIVEHKVDTVSVVDVSDFKRSVYFSVGSSKLDASSNKTLLEVVDFLRQHPQAKVRVLGFASSDGNAKRNEQLAQQRMQAAVSFLKEAGITNQVETFTGGVDRQVRNYHLARRVDITLAK
ncbi:MAG: OmpA family protein [Porphyromonadaceae bacterium]|nr:OmpA family protein [Porphyromonadaceae bacterium]